MKHPGSRRTFEVTEIRALVKHWKTGGCYAQMPRSWIGKNVICKENGVLFLVKGGKTGPGYVVMPCGMVGKFVPFRRWKAE